MTAALKINTEDASRDCKLFIKPSRV